MALRNGLVARGGGRFKVKLWGPVGRQGGGAWRVCLPSSLGFHDIILQTDYEKRQTYQPEGGFLMYV